MLMFWAVAVKLVRLELDREAPELSVTKTWYLYWSLTTRSFPFTEMSFVADVVLVEYESMSKVGSWGINCLSWNPTKPSPFERLT